MSFSDRNELSDYSIHDGISGKTGKMANFVALLILVLQSQTLEGSNVLPAFRVAVKELFRQ